VTNLVEIDSIDAMKTIQADFDNLIAALIALRYMSMTGSM